jgi:hypothetical protein
MSYIKNENEIITNPSLKIIFEDDCYHYAYVMWAKFWGVYYYGLNYHFRNEGGASYGVSIKGPSFETFEAMMTAAIKELVDASPDKEIKKRIFPGLQLELNFE